jgi:hypothetical protein
MRIHHASSFVKLSRKEPEHMFLLLRLRRHMNNAAHITSVAAVAPSDFNWSCWAAKQILLQSATLHKLGFCKILKPN